MRTRTVISPVVIAQLLGTLKQDVGQALVQLPRALKEFDDDLERSGDLGEMKSVAIHNLLGLRNLVEATLLRPIDRALAVLGYKGTE